MKYNLAGDTYILIQVEFFRSLVKLYSVIFPAMADPEKLDKLNVDRELFKEIAEALSSL